MEGVCREVSGGVWEGGPGPGGGCEGGPGRGGLGGGVWFVPTVVTLGLGGGGLGGEGGA